MIISDNSYVMIITKNSAIPFLCDKRYHGYENIINEKTVLGRLEHVWQLLKCKDSTYIIMTVL